MKNKLVEKKIEIAKVGAHNCNLELTFFFFNILEFCISKWINEHYEDFHAKLLNVEHSTNKNESESNENEFSDEGEDKDDNPFLTG